MNLKYYDLAEDNYEITLKLWYQQNLCQNFCITEFRFTFDRLASESIFLNLHINQNQVVSKYISMFTQSHLM